MIRFAAPVACIRLELSVASARSQCGGVRIPGSVYEADCMSLSNYSEEQRINPLDVVERLAAVNDWSFERSSEDEITILVTGKWTDYQVSYTWMGDIEALHLACAFDLRVPDRRRPDIQQLISLIN